MILRISLMFVLLCGCSSWQDPLQSHAVLSKTLKNLPHVPPAICPNPNWSALTFNQSIAAGLCHHPDTRAAYAEMEKQSAAWGHAQTAYLPTLSASYRREHRQSSTSYAADSHQQNPGRFLAEMQWVLFDFGERAANREQQMHLLRLAGAGYDQQLQSRWVAIARHYLHADIAARKQSITADYVDTTAQILDTVTTLHQAGITIGAEVEEAQVEYQRAKLQWLQNEQAQRNAQAALAESMGYAVDTEMQLTSSDDQPFISTHTERIKNLITQMLDNHPAIVEAQAQLDATKAAMEAHRHAGSPQIFLYANTNLNHHLHSRGISYRENDHVIGIGIRWPLFEGYSRLYQQKQHQAQIEKEQAALEALKSRLSLELWQAYQQWQSAQSQREVAHQGVSSAEKSVQTRLGRYRAGVGELRDLLQAQRNLHELRLADLDARQAQQEASLQLLFSLGQITSKISKI